MLLNAETSNNQYHDIRNLAAAKFTKGCAGIEISGIGCVIVTGQSLQWNDAKAKCESMGMTLPDRGTLKSLYNQKARNPTLPQSGWVWSSSEFSTEYAWGIGFHNGFELYGHKFNHPYGVLCVE